MNKVISKVLGIIGCGMICAGGCLVTEAFFWLSALLLFGGMAVCAVSVLLHPQPVQTVVNEPADAWDEPCIHIWDEQDNEVIVSAPLTDFTLTYLTLKAKEYGNEQHMERI